MFVGHDRSGCVTKPHCVPVKPDLNPSSKLVIGEQIFSNYHPDGQYIISCDTIVMYSPKGKEVLFEKNTYLPPEIDMNNFIAVHFTDNGIYLLLTSEYETQVFFPFRQVLL